jgi:hypothetical protein
VAHLEDARSSSWFLSNLYLNGNIIGGSHVREKNGPVYRPLTLQSTLNLKTGDQLWVAFSSSGKSYLVDSDEGFHLTHFTGFMLEEEIVSSL